MAQCYRKEVRLSCQSVASVFFVFTCLVSKFVNPARSWLFAVTSGVINSWEDSDLGDLCSAQTSLSKLPYLSS